MFPADDLPQDLLQSAVAAGPFDLYRLVNPRNHTVFSYRRGDEGVSQVEGACYDFWNREAPCRNCTSKICRALDAVMIKIEYHEGRIIFVMSLPVEVDGIPYALELAKDATDSLMVASAQDRGNLEITTMISRFNELATLDAFTELYNANRINALLDDTIDLERTSPDTAPPRPLLFYLDIQDFSSVNDTYGRSVGDDVMLFLAKHLRIWVEEHEGWAGRLQGDEFCAFLPNTALEHAREVLQPLIDQIAEHRFYPFDSEIGAFRIELNCAATAIHPADQRDDLLARLTSLGHSARESGLHWAEG